MEVSIPCCNTQVSVIDHNVIDETRTYDKTKQEPYSPDEILQSADKLYQYVGTETFTPITWTQTAENAEEYAVGDVLYKSNLVVLTTSVGSHDVAQQPEDYSYNTSWLYDQWTTRYTRLYTVIPGSPTSSIFANVPVGDTLHSLYYAGSASPTNYFHRLEYQITLYAWGTMLYTLDLATKSTIVWFPAQDRIEVWWKGGLKAVIVYTVTPAYGTVFLADGIRYKNGAGMYTDSNGSKYYEVSGEYSYENTVYEYEAARVTYASDLDVYENTAISNGDPIRENWFGRHYIIRGTELYLRTHVDSPVVTVPVTENVYETIDTLDTFPNFADIGVVNYLKPFDGKKYTNVSQDGPITYTLESTAERFDTIGMAGIVANDIEVVFKLPDGSTAAHIESYEPRNYRDETINNDGTITNVLDPYPTTAILYSIADEPMPISSTIEITFKGGLINIGTILLGLNVNAGFTNLQFSTKFKDWSPKEVDQWGNVTYITADSGGNTVDVKTLTWNGTVDIPLGNFDMTTRLMTSMGAKTLIINGSDSTNNEPPNNEEVFASTMLIGRLKDFDLKTKIKNKKLDDYATYSIVVEEDI